MLLRDKIKVIRMSYILHYKYFTRQLFILIFLYYFLCYFIYNFTKFKVAKY